ncbi:hypothetical protein VO64_0122 [Pseudomonas synxantha]|uniref:Threonine synthase n=1 Tax=Pseudomonas synxantha TaxID=47883 RepID=A0AAU8TCQ2_9PSED|nr:hypothetical protein VO64_0122 [Pseudomonas synxantha]
MVERGDGVGDCSRGHSIRNGHGVSPGGDLWFLYSRFCSSTSACC